MMELTSCFVDTSFWIASYRRHDQYSDRAKAWRKWLIAHQIKLVTTEAVLWEWLNGMSDIETRQEAANGYRYCHDDPQIDVVPFRADLVISAFDLYEARSDKEWSLTDCLSFVVMNERRITDALTTDHHFEQSGFSILLRREPPE
jgi:predicted nucleic acid-binding protein